jgi:hypothetical protein
MVSVFICLLRKVRRIHNLGKNNSPESERTSKALRNLCKMLKFFQALSTYLVIYSIISNVQARILSSPGQEESFDKEICNVIMQINNVDLVLWVIQRIF